MTIKEFLFSNKYGSLRYKVIRFFKHKLPFTKTWNRYHNPLYYWWKSRKVFKRPKAHFHIGKIEWFFGFPCRRDYLNCFIDFRMCGLGWKDKWDSPRHEWDPYIAITFFRKWWLIWIFNWSNKEENSSLRSMATWEAMLDYLYYNKSIEECIARHAWKGEKNGIETITTIHKNLKINN